MIQKQLRRIPIVDAHLDLAENVTFFGRDLTSEVTEIRVLENRKERQATVSLPEIVRGGIAVVIATVTPGFLVKDVGEGFEPKKALYETAEEAEAHALIQIQLYEQWESLGLVRLIKSTHDLEHHLELWREDGKPGLVLLMESADPIVNVRDLTVWWRRGLRLIGLTYGDTKYGAGVGGGSGRIRKEGLTTQGIRLLERMAEMGFIWDISHLTEEGIWQGIELGYPRICASHANAQALTPSNRHLSDEVISAVAERNGVIGLVLYNGFLEPRWTKDKSVSVTLADQVRRHAEHIASLSSWEHVGIGSDLDGGFGLEESPVEIGSIADLHEVAASVPTDAQEKMLSINWLSFLRCFLP